MSATEIRSVLKSLEIDSARVEALSEADLCELIGFIEYDCRLRAADGDDLSEAFCDEPPPAERSTTALPAGIRHAPHASCRE